MNFGAHLISSGEDTAGVTNFNTTNVRASPATGNFAVSICVDPGAGAITVTDNKGNGVYPQVGPTVNDGLGGRLMWFVKENGIGGAGHTINVQSTGAMYVTVGHYLIENGGGTGMFHAQAAASGIGTSGQISANTLASGALPQKGEIVIWSEAANQGADSATPYVPNIGRLLYQDANASAHWTHGAAYDAVQSVASVNYGLTKGVSVGFYAASIIGAKLNKPTSLTDYDTVYYLNGSSVSPHNVTMDSAASGNVILAFVLGFNPEWQTPTDNKGNTWSSTPLHQSVYFADKWGGYGLTVFAKTAAAGGTGHVISLAHPSNPTVESTVMAVAVNGTSILDQSVVARDKNSTATDFGTYTSNTVTVPAGKTALLVAVWSGDGYTEVLDMRAYPLLGSGWTQIGGTFLENTAYIQHAIAVKEVGPGTHSITWEAANNQGSILSLVAVETGSTAGLVGYGPVSGTPGGATSGSFTLPAGVQPGDVMVAAISWDSQLSAAAAVFSMPDWTMLDERMPWGGDTQTSSLWYRVATGTDSADWTATSLNKAIVGVIGAWRGMVSTAPEFVWTLSPTTGSVSSYNFATTGITTTAGDSVALFVQNDQFAANSVVTYSGGSPMTLLTQGRITDTWTNVALFNQDGVGAGTNGAVTVNAAIADSNTSNFAAWAVRLQSASGGGGPTAIDLTSDVLKNGWRAHPGPTLFGAIDETTADDADYIESQNLTAPAVLGLNAPQPAGSYSIAVRAKRSSNVGQFRVRFLSAANVDVGGSDWQALSNSYTNYTVSATTTAEAVNIRIEVQA